MRVSAVADLVFFFSPCEVFVMLGQVLSPLPRPVFETEASNQATQCKSKRPEAGEVEQGVGGACALLTALSGSGGQ